MQTTKKRNYNRRSDAERIAELQRRVEDLKAKQAARQKKEDPLLRELPKLQRQLRKFGQLAMDHQRPDISNSIWAFSTSLDRTLRLESEGRLSSRHDEESPEDL